MAELLVRIVDKSNPNDPQLDAKCHKRGDVVSIQPDGWAWSALEKSAPWWRIIKIPGATIEDLSAFLAEEPGDPVTNKLLRKRAFSFDLDAYSADMKVTIPTNVPAIERRKSPRPGPANAELPSTNATTATSRYKKQKTPMPDPNVIS